MENILKEINLKIKEIVSENEIDTQKLQELIHTRDRLKGYMTTSISQVQGFNNNYSNLVTPATPIFQGMQRNNTLYDSITDFTNIFLKNQTKQLEMKNEVSKRDLIFYHKFIDELNPSSDKTINLERCEIKNDLEMLIMKEFRNTINERKQKNKEQEKDKIIDTTLEIKNQETQI